MAEALYPCKRCNYSVPFKDVHYGNNGRDILCPSCFTLTVKRQLVKEKPAHPEITNSGKILKQKYVCVKCRYHFVYGKSEATLRCPFCGHTELLKDDFTAEKLLDEAINMI